MAPADTADRRNGSGTRARGPVLAVPAASWWTRLWRPFWALPVAICALAILVGVLLPTLEQEGDLWLPYVFQGGPDGARSVLSTIASAMISVTGLVFSITIVALQLASSQFTPRVLSTFLSSRITQVTLGVFTASFLFSLSVLRSVKGANEEAEAFVPQASVTLAFFLVMASVASFFAFIHHITTSIQVARVISDIGDATVHAVDRMYPQRHDGDDGSRHAPTWSPRQDAERVVVDNGRRHGMVTHVDTKGLLGLAAALEATVTVDARLGEFVAPHQPIARIWDGGEVPDSAADAVRRHIVLGGERELRQDIGFGLRQLVDIADRALSPGINDPTTALQVIDEVHRVMRDLLTREMPSPYVSDGDGAVRVVHPPQAIPELLRFPVEEIAHYGADSVRILPRLREMVADLQTCALDAYQPMLATLDETLANKSLTSR